MNISIRHRQPAEAKGSPRLPGRRDGPEIRAGEPGARSCVSPSSLVAIFHAARLMVSTYEVPEVQGTIEEVATEKVRRAAELVRPLYSLRSRRRVYEHTLDR